MYDMAFEGEGEISSASSSSHPDTILQARSWCRPGQGRTPRVCEGRVIDLVEITCPILRNYLLMSGCFLNHETFDAAPFLGLGLCQS